MVGSWHVVTERLKRAVMYSFNLDPRCSKWKILSLSWPKLVIALITRYAVMFVSSPRVSSWSPLLLIRTLLKNEEVCLPIHEVLNCWLNSAASCLGDGNELPLEVITLFSASRSILLVVIHSLVRSVFWSMASTKYLLFKVCVYRCDSECLYSVLTVPARWRLFYAGHVVWSSHLVSLLAQVPHVVCVLH